jgi:hypothetical protein
LDNLPKETSARLAALFLAAAALSFLLSGLAAPLAQAQETPRRPAPAKAVIFAPPLRHYGPEDPYAEAFKKILDRQRWARRVSLRHFPAEAQTNPRAVQKTLEALAEEPEVKALILSGAPFGSLEGCARLKARRPDILIIALEPDEAPQEMSRSAGLVVSLNHAARGFLLPVLAQRAGARALINFSFPRHQKLHFFNRQRRIMAQAAEDLGLELIEADHCPDPLTAEKDAVAAFIEETLDDHLKRHQGRLAFHSADAQVSELLTAFAVRRGGLALDPGQPALFLGIPEVLNLAKPTHDLFGQWNRLLALADEHYMNLRPPGQIATWPYPYPWTAMLALTEIALSSLDGQTDLYDLKNLGATLEKHSPGSKWQVHMVIDHDRDAVVPQLAVILADSYWFGQGYQGFTRLNLPSKYNRVR